MVYFYDCLLHIWNYIIPNCFITWLLTSRLGDVSTSIHVNLPLSLEPLLSIPLCLYSTLCQLCIYTISIFPHYKWYFHGIAVLCAHEYFSIVIPRCRIIWSNGLDVFILKDTAILVIAKYYMLGSILTQYSYLWHRYYHCLYLELRKLRYREVK